MQINNIDKQLFMRRIVFYLLSFTWGAILSFIGLAVILVSLPLKKVKLWHGRLYAVWGESWGGLELGCFWICGEKDQTEYLLAHEAGHGIQNIIYGPLVIFISFIPSMIHYWHYEFYYRKHGKYPGDYYEVWFEKTASDWGLKYVVNDKI